MGANPIASNGSIMTSAGIRERLQRVGERGGQLVVIDPRRTETAELADQHLFIKPATDVYFLLAFVHVLFRDKLIRTAHLRDIGKRGRAANQCVIFSAGIGNSQITTCGLSARWCFKSVHFINDECVNDVLPTH